MVVDCRKCRKRALVNVSQFLAGVEIPGFEEDVVMDNAVVLVHATVIGLVANSLVERHNDKGVTESVEHLPLANGTNQPPQTTILDNKSPKKNSLILQRR